MALVPTSTPSMMPLLAHHRSIVMTPATTTTSTTIVKAIVKLEVRLTHSIRTTNSLIMSMTSPWRHSTRSLVKIYKPLETP